MSPRLMMHMVKQIDSKLLLQQLPILSQQFNLSTADLSTKITQFDEAKEFPDQRTWDLITTL